MNTTIITNRISNRTFSQKSGLVTMIEIVDLGDILEEISDINLQDDIARARKHYKAGKAINFSRVKRK